MSFIVNIFSDLIFSKLKKRTPSKHRKDNAASLYIDLLKKSVSNSIYDDDLDLMSGIMGDQLQEQKYLGGIWPSRAHTMIGSPRLNNIQYCMEEVLTSGVRGDFIETGVWRGGASIFMRGILKAYGVTDRMVWVADSFEGLPPPDHIRYPKEYNLELHRINVLAVSLDEVQKNFDRYDLLDDQVCFLKGWFRDTLPSAPIKELAVMRLDGDMYESTVDALINLYPKLSPGGFVIIDDYNCIQSCNDAVLDFRKEKNIKAELSLISGAGAFWRKEPD